MGQAAGRARARLAALGRGAILGARRSGGNYRKGEEVLLDALLLSRCDFLLHSASGVAEFAIYWNPALHGKSVHLQYTYGRQTPPWMAAATSRPLGLP